MPPQVVEIDESVPVAPLEELHHLHRFYCNNCSRVKDEYNERYYLGCDANRIVDKIMDDFISYEDVKQVLFKTVGNVALWNLIEGKTKMPDQKIPTIYHITFTSDPNKSEEQNAFDITRYRKRLEKFPHFWVWEHGTTSEKYHQHMVVQCPYKDQRRDQNLKPTNYYNARVHSEPVERNKLHLRRLVNEYLCKENKPEGDLEYFRNLINVY